MAREGILLALAKAALGIVRSSTRSARAGTSRVEGSRARLRERPRPRQTEDGRASAHERVPAGIETVEVRPEQVRGLRLHYAPARDGAPDGGEIVWTWVPYAENDGRGKDRPVLVIGPHTAERAYAVKLTSRAHDGDREYLPIGSGDWDAAGRPSWVDLDQLYSVHVDGMRREAAALDARRFGEVASALQRRYGWEVQR